MFAAAQALGYQVVGAFRVPALDPGVTPNMTGLPGLALIKSIVGALFWPGIWAAVGAIIVGAILWFVGSSSDNPSRGAQGKKTIFAACIGAIIIGGANAIVAFFSAAGSTI